MAKFTRAKRQAIIDQYLNETGENLFIPGQFIDWLADKPDHEAHPWFFGQDDAAAAREHRIALARRMASGLRIVTANAVTDDAGNILRIRVGEAPMLISPMGGRADGGGYHAYDPADPAHRAELRAQGEAALRSWVRRYAAAFEPEEAEAIEEIATGLGRVALAG